MIDSGIINDAYKERDPQEEINRFKRRAANIATILNREGLRTREKTFLNQKKEDIEKEIARLKNKAQKTRRPRTKVAEKQYITAASRAHIILIDHANAGLLPAHATREEKLEILKT